MKKKILIVDDDRAILDLLTKVLSINGFEVVAADNVIKFREFAFSHTPDLIILDIGLGEHDGTQIHQELVWDGFDRNVPVIFLTGLAEDHPPTTPQPGRRFALVGKPFDMKELVQGVQVMLSSNNELPNGDANPISDSSAN